MAEDRPRTDRAQLEPLSVLWRVFSAPQTLLLLMALLALTLAVGSWVPQIPPQAASDPQAWLAAQPGFFGQENPLIRALGLHELYHSLWFRLLLVVTGLVLFVRTVDAAELAWATGGRSRGAVPLAGQWRLPAQRITASRSLAELRPRVEELLARRGYEPREVPASPMPVLVAGRRVLALWVRPAGYFALLLALLGLFLASTWGWQDDPVQLLPGESRSAGHGTPFGFRLDSFRLHLDNRGQLAGYESEITWLEGQAELDREVAGIGRPARHARLALHQAGFAPVVRLRVQDEAGRPLRLEGGSAEASSGDELLIRFATPEDQPLVFLPRLERFLALSFDPQCDSGRPAVHVDVLDEAGANRQRLGSLGSSGALPLGDGQVTAELSYVPILRVESRPSLGPALVAALLALLFLALAWVLPARLAWLALLALGEGRSGIEVTALTGAGQREWLAALARTLEEAAQDGD